MSKALVVIPLACGLVVGVVAHSLGTGFVALYLMLLFEALFGWSTGRRWPRAGRADATMRVIDAMDGVEFEGYVAARLRRAGWRVKFTPPVGDYGVDLIGEKDGHSVAVQCKRLRQIGGRRGRPAGGLRRPPPRVRQEHCGEQPGIHQCRKVIGAHSRMPIDRPQSLTSLGAPARRGRCRSCGKKNGPAGV
jgi:hypothetical protein